MINHVTGLRRIAKSAALLGSSNLARVLIGVLRTKAVAVTLGPSGIAMLGLFTNLTTAASLISTFGLDVSGVRQIARALAQGDQRQKVVVAHTLISISWTFGIVGAIAFWLMRSQLARHFGIGLSVSGTDIGWLSIGVALGAIGAGYLGCLTGLGMIREIAAINIGAAALWTIIAIASVWLLGRNGIVVTAIAGPASVWALAMWYSHKKVPVLAPPTRSELSSEAPELLRLGGIIALSGVAASVGQLAVRSLIQKGLGTDFAGYFQASWLISVTVLVATSTALSTEFYPRVAEAVANGSDSAGLANHQLEVTASFFGPVVILISVLAPSIIKLAYSEQFVHAAVQLRWQVAGDLLRSITWPLGLYLLALGASRRYLALELCWQLTYVLLLWAGLRHFGLAAVGQSFTLATAVYLICELAMLHRLVGFRLSIRNVTLISLCCCCSWVVTILATRHPILSAVIGGIGASVVGIHALLRLDFLNHPARPR